MAEKWKILSQKVLLRSKFFKLRVDECELPDHRIMPEYYVIEFGDWVHVIPFTTDGKIIMVEQYRHAAGKRFLEVPGGAVDDHKGESPEAAARRELLEETGYECGSLDFVGSHYPNPALQSNQMHTFLAKDCVKIKEQQLDPFEDLSVQLLTPDKLKKCIEQGQITHSLMLASLQLVIK